MQSDLSLYKMPHFTSFKTSYASYLTCEKERVQVRAVPLKSFGKALITFATLGPVVVSWYLLKDLSCIALSVKSFD